jgi:voltage-gated potassium channel
VARDADDREDKALLKLWLSVAALFFITAAGSVGYYIIEDISPLDSVYYTVITLTTIGYGEPRGAFSETGRFFTIILIVTGVGTFSYFAGTLARVIVSGEIQRSLGNRRMEDRLKKLENHFIVCGYGRLGRAISKPFRERQTPFAIVEIDRGALENAVADGCVAILGDASNEDTLENAGIARARGLIAACAEDAMNVFITLTARQMRPDLYILARGNSESTLKKLTQAGATRAFSPHDIGGVYMAQAALRPSVVDFFDMTTMLGAQSILLEEVQVPLDAPREPQSLRKLDLGRRFGVIIVAIKHNRDGGQIEFNPTAQSMVAPGDLLIALGEDKNLKKMGAHLGLKGGEWKEE